MKYSKRYLEKRRKQLLAGNELKLNKLSLIAQQTFKLLNASCFYPKYEVVFFVGQSLQIVGAVVILNSIKVVNNPSFGQFLAVCPLPHNNVLKDITIPICSRVLPVPYKNIAISMKRATALPPMSSLHCGVGYPSKTMVLFHFAFSTSLGGWANNFATINAIAFMFFIPSFIIIFLQHIFIVSYKTSNV